MSGFLMVAMAAQAVWADAFAARDWGRLAALYAPEVQFWGSTAALHTGTAGVLAYFAGLPPGFTGARFAVPHIVGLGADSFAASGSVVFGWLETELPYRMTQVFVRSADGWRIAVHHASPRPGEA